MYLFCHFVYDKLQVTHYEKVLTCGCLLIMPGIIAYLVWTQKHLSVLYWLNSFIFHETWRCGKVEQHLYKNSRNQTFEPSRFISELLPAW